ncbi:unnamed protein product [Sphenostylis stenocarpa]|uniref:Uncharacterized protein n=1 Tax=Sphenostylis stenocarpa TaxID=92480 RepID=A0AA86S5L1_9FABA|nr:unnamed protein product [Sphenostylis stenocarpa]
MRVEGEGGSQDGAVAVGLPRNHLPIPLIEVRANIMFCFPSTFMFSTRRMCWNSLIATRDCTKTTQKDGNDTIFFAEKEEIAAEALALGRLGICILGFPRSVLCCGYSHPLCFIH